MALDLRKYKTQINDLEVGNTVRVNHEDCPAGEDTRRRLYITRPIGDADKVIGYCHNCQDGGGRRTGTHQSYRDQRHTGNCTAPITKVTDKLYPPPNMIETMSLWPVEAQAWAYANGLTASIALAYGIQFDPSTGRVYLPRYDSLVSYTRGNLQGYQLRNVTPNTRRPKYLTTTLSTDKGFTSVILSEPAAPLRKVAVVVEDLLSGIHVAGAFYLHENIAVTAFVNYGTKLNMELMAEVSKSMNVAVWLDNDSAHVCEQADHMRRTINLINPGSAVVRINVEADPKHLEYTDIVDEIENITWL